MCNSEGKKWTLCCLERCFLSQHFLTAELNTSMSPVMTAMHRLLFSNKCVCVCVYVWSFAVLRSLIMQIAFFTLPGVLCITKSHTYSVSRPNLRCKTF